MSLDLGATTSRSPAFILPRKAIVAFCSSTTQTRPAWVGRKVMLSGANQESGLSTLPLWPADWRTRFASAGTPTGCRSVTPSSFNRSADESLLQPPRTNSAATSPAIHSPAKLTMAGEWGVFIGCPRGAFVLVRLRRASRVRPPPHPSSDECPRSKHYTNTNHCRNASAKPETRPVRPRRPAGGHAADVSSCAGRCREAGGGNPCPGPAPAAHREIPSRARRPPGAARKSCNHGRQYLTTYL